VLVANEFMRITLNCSVAVRAALGRLRMKRFFLLRLYVVGVVALVALAVFGASLWRTAADAGTPQKPEAGTAASTRNAEPSPSSPTGIASVADNLAAGEAVGATEEKANGQLC
jgi:hypothetical protein